MIFTSFLFRQHNAWFLLLPSVVFFLKYALAYWLPELLIWLKAMRWIAIFSLRLPDLLLTCLMVFPDDFCLGAKPAYLAKAAGEWKRSMFLISAITAEASTVPQPFIVGSFCATIYCQSVGIRNHRHLPCRRRSWTKPHINTRGPMTAWKKFWPNEPGEKENRHKRTPLPREAVSFFFYKKLNKKY